MPSIYGIALMLMRVFGRANLVGGITALIAVVPVAVTGVHLGGDANSLAVSLMMYLLEWGFTATIMGCSLLLLAKPIARFAAKQ